MEREPGKVRANAYDMVINGVEMGGGSIRIHNREMQQKVFSLLGTAHTLATHRAHHTASPTHLRRASTPLRACCARADCLRARPARARCSSRPVGFSPEEAKAQFGFLLGAFEYGAPPHGGLAFGLDRMCTLIGGGSSIRDYIAFPKNNQGRDVMISAPSEIAQKQLDELSIATAVRTPAPMAASS